VADVGYALDLKQMVLRNSWPRAGGECFNHLERTFLHHVILSKTTSNHSQYIPLDHYHGILTTLTSGAAI